MSTHRFLRKTADAPIEIMEKGTTNNGTNQRGSGIAILQLNDSYKPIIDGVAVCAENYARWLHRRNPYTGIVAPRCPGYHDTDEFPVFRYLSLPIPGWAPYRLGLPRVDAVTRSQLYRWIPDDDTPIVIHTHAPFASGAMAHTLRSHLIRKNRTVRLVGTFHSKYRDDFLRVFPDAVVDQIIGRIQRYYRSLDAVWAPNTGTARTLREYGYQGEIQIVPNGSDFEPPTPQEYERLRSTGGALLKAPEGEQILLFVGQHRWEKNTRLILEALGKLAQDSPGRGNATSLPRWRMVFVGDGPDMGGMKRLSRELGLCNAPGKQDLVLFYGPILDRQVLTALYARSDLFVFPSLYDNSPLVVREAAAFYTPSILAIGSDAAGDTINEFNAFHVEPHSESLKTMVTRLLTSDEVVKEVGRNAATTFRSWRDIVSEVEERYRNLLG